MPRFFVESADVKDGAVKITGDDARHIARSLRMAVGDEITVCDGEGAEHTCSLTKIRDEECECKILSTQPSRSEPQAEIALFMAYPKGDKLETVVQKAVELGVSTVIPFESSRCIKRPSPEKGDKQTARLSRIAAEAAKQCGRAKLPKILPPIKLTELISMLPSYDMSLICYEDEEKKSIKQALDNASPRSIAVIVGCEGGFSYEEWAAITEAGAISVTLGPRILRCETAPLYALAAISYRFEL